MDNGRVTVISDTIQEYRGQRFYLCGYYFQNKGLRLHRAVWESHNGCIPEGYHVHHIDGDRANNQIENLALMPGLAHIQEHAKEETRSENGKRAIVIAITKAPEWHRSDAGKEWHSQHAKAYWEDAPMHDYVCTMCGKVFQSRVVRHGGNHFCHQNCRAKYGRRKRAGLL